MGRARYSPLLLLLGAAVAACLVSVGLGLAVSQDGDGVRHRRSSNSSSPPEPPKDSNGRPLPPPDGYAHGRGKREVTARHSSPFATAEEYNANGVLHLRHRRSSNSSSPPEPPKDSNGRPLPPPDGYAHGRGKREVTARHSSPFAIAEEYNADGVRHRRSSNSSSPPEPPKDSNGRPLPPPDGYAHGRGKRDVTARHSSPFATAEEYNAVAEEGRSEKQPVSLERERRASNHSGPPPRGPPPSRGRRQLQVAEEGRSEKQPVSLERERRASNHSGPPPRGPPPSRGRRQLQEDGEVAHSLRQRRASTSDGNSSSSDDSSDEDYEEDWEPDSPGPGRGPPPRGRPPPGGPQHGRGPPPRGCGGRRPPSDSGTNSTDTSTDTVERLSRPRNRNRG